ncbi:MAG: M15 family metallopeptidase [Ignavibacteriaceae bacterium]|jgi:D-alanyl-D-alanine dipeptidase|nr:M15 family metallopeptidase [Ignavibacteriaceae bacterium]
MRYRFTSVVFFFLFVIANYAQEIPKNKYGLPVVNDFALYKEQIKKDSAKALIDLEKFIPGLFIDVRYASENNFAKTKFYESQKIFLRLPAAVALKKIQEELLKQNLSLKIFDAYRPYSVTEKMWEFVHDARYAADPKTGSRHNRACAVDVTLVDLETKTELEMPTPYDDFTEKAHHNYNNLPENILKNRELLKKIMTKYGFETITSEWWHYDFSGWKNFELLNIPFEELEKHSIY